MKNESDDFIDQPEKMLMLRAEIQRCHCGISGKGA